MGSLNPSSAVPPTQPDYALPIARTGEQQFAAIVRQRSGMDAGNIDMAARFIDHLNDADQQDAVDAAFGVYDKWRRETGKKARRDTSA